MPAHVGDWFGSMQLRVKDDLDIRELRMCFYFRPIESANDGQSMSHLFEESEEYWPFALTVLQMPSSGIRIPNLLGTFDTSCLPLSGRP